MMRVSSATAASSSAGHDPVDEAPRERGRGVDRLAGQQHLHDALPRDVAADADGGRRAEHADIDAGSANFAVSAATARSHIDTSWQPAAVARPCTRAITGCGRRVSFSIVRCTRRKARAASRHRVRAHLLQSWPAQNPRPLAASTTTRVCLSAAIRSSSARVPRSCRATTR
jgi:hypothetical protein